MNLSSAIEKKAITPYLEAIERSKQLPPLASITPTLATLFPDRLATAEKPLEFSEYQHPPLSPSSSESKPILWDLFALQIQAEERLEQLSSIQLKDLKEASQRHEGFAMLMAKKQRELADGEADASSWERYREISATATTALTFFAAAALTPGGAATAYASYALWASGSAALFNQGMSLTKGWHWVAGLVASSENSQAKLASLLEKSASVGSTLLGLVTLGFSATSLTATPLWRQAFSARYLPTKIAQAADIVTAYLGIQSGVATANNFTMQKEVKVSENGSSYYKYRSSELTKSLREGEEHRQNLYQACSEATQSYLTSLKLAAQPV